MYHLIKAQAKKKMGELTEAIQTLQMAMSLPNVRRAASSAKCKHKKIELSPANCVSVFLELAEALWLNGEQAGLTTSHLRLFQQWLQGSVVSITP